MSGSIIRATDSSVEILESMPAMGTAFAREERPIKVRDAALYLGVSPQTVYRWAKRKHIPHLRVMGRNIRFFKSELEPFRSQYRQEVGNV